LTAFKFTNEANASSHMSACLGIFLCNWPCLIIDSGTIKSIFHSIYPLATNDYLVFQLINILPGLISFQYIHLLFPTQTQFSSIDATSIDLGIPTN